MKRNLTLDEAVQYVLMPGSDSEMSDISDHDDQDELDPYQPIQVER